MRLGQRIKKLRQSKGVSQQELADKLRYLNQSQVSKIEKGDRKVTALDLTEISKILGVTVDELAMDIEEQTRRKEGRG